MDVCGCAKRVLALVSRLCTSGQINDHSDVDHVPSVGVIPNVFIVCCGIVLLIALLLKNVFNVAPIRSSNNEE
jgi:hypothetical protein